MLLNYEDLSPVKKAVEVEIPADRISTEAQRVTTEFSRQAKLPGFRPGKVPVNVVRTRFAKEIQEEVMSRLCRSVFAKPSRTKTWSRWEIRTCSGSIRTSKARQSNTKRSSRSSRR